MEKTELLRQIKNEVLNLTASPLYAYRQENNFFPVIGEGSHSAEIVLVGEAPGQNEAKTGRPFCGASGRVLDKLLESAGLARAKVYITNIVKDRPPENRDPTPGEIRLYGPFLDRQMEIIKPKTVVSLGRLSMKYLMEKFNLMHLFEPISQLHGKIFVGETNFGKVKFVALYHPAVGVYNAGKIPELKKDFKNIL
ncbi:MAG: uracil-DNA glycosylase [Patescibacteria group bacterium]